MDRIVTAIRDQGKDIAGARIMISGIAYKPDIDDIRETPAARHRASSIAWLKSAITIRIVRSFLR